MVAETKEWNPRYSAYAKAHKHTEDEQLVSDREESNCGFSLWIRQQWRDFCKEEEYDYGFRLCWAKEFDIWLNKKVGM